MSDLTTTQTYERYKQQLQRIAWRLQYRTHTRLRKELPILYDFSSSPSFAEEVDSQLLVEQWIHSLPKRTRNYTFPLYSRKNRKTSCPTI